MQPYKPEKVFVERAVAESVITRNVLGNLPMAQVEWIDEAGQMVDKSRRWNPSIARAKQSLVLARHPGRFFKPCPAGTTKTGRRNVCCNYFVVNFASNCHMECSYCYLQAYLNLPYMVVHANVEDLLDELGQVFSSNPRSHYRVGTGELADSLALDSLTGYSRPLVEFFAGFTNAALEFKTKSNCVENLLQLDHRGRTVVSWSINPPTVVQAEEHKTASFEQRLAAAEKCSAAGYPIVFHFDPLIHYPEWEKDYRSLVEEIFQRIPPRSVPWVSLGALRMPPRLKALVRERFPRSGLPLGELLPTEDGKLRYFKPIRVEMLSKMRAWITAASPQTRIYSCMENTDVWQKVFQSQQPPSEVELGDSLLQLL